jgi:hypothetical protein
MKPSIHPPTDHAAPAGPAPAARAARSAGAGRPVLLLAIALVAAAVVAGIATLASRGVGTVTTATGRSTTGSPSAMVTNPGPLVVGDGANGSTVTLHQGQTLRVVLGSPGTAGSTYWSFAPLPTAVLSAQGDPTVTPDRSGGTCGRPGTGCGTVALTLTAHSPGTASVAATRSTCGEAMRCAPGRDSFHLTVVVTR